MGQILGKISAELHELLKHPEHLFKDPSVEILNIVSSQTNDSAELRLTCKRLAIKMQHGDQTLVVKYFFPQTCRRKLYYKFLRRDPLLNAYLTQQQLLLETTIQTARAHCWHKESGYAFSFLVLDYLENHIPVVDHLRNCCSDNRATKLQLIHWLAVETANMHNQGFFHRDIKPSNLFVNSSGSLVWIDLDRAMYRRELSMNQRVNNLYYMIRYFVFSLDWNYALPFVHSYCAHTNGEISTPETLFAKALKLHCRQTRVETKRQTRRFADGFLDKEDFSIY